MAAQAEDTGGAKKRPPKRPITRKVAAKPKAAPVTESTTAARVSAAKAAVTASVEAPRGVDRPMPVEAPAPRPLVKPAVPSVKADEVVMRAAAQGFGAASTAANRGGIRHSDVTNFLRQLIMMLQAGTPILRSLRTLSKRGERVAMRDLVTDITQYVEAGNPLWQSFDRHPRYFDTVFVNLIKASEASGNLVPVLKRTVTFREERELMIKRVRGAMIYPVLLVVVSMGVLLLITNLVVPEFKDMFVKSNLQMPAITQNFIAATEIFNRIWWVPIVALIGIIFLYYAWFVRDARRRLFADRMKLKIPVLGTILHKHALVELTRTMTMLLRSGLSMMATLELTRSAIHNRAVAQSLQAVRDSVEQGGGLEAPLRKAAPVIPPVMTDMFVTGEESGSVDQVTEQIADVYEEEVKIAVDSLGEALQPIFTIVIGVGVIFLFVALFLPLISMMDQLTGSGV
ncbi:MAG: type II secretion system F family protein [Candidatus Hydrogenedentes bacterium]|nr:type II secretion system F family protein [Candidatus Hydrogenedentota bacterium]